jgi:hypothetical protein
MQSSVIYKNSVRTSQETYYISDTKPNRLILFGETFAVYCENRTEHTDTLYGQNENFSMSKQVVHIVTTVLRRVKVSVRSTFHKFMCCIRSPR